MKRLNDGDKHSYEVSDQEMMVCETWMNEKTKSDSSFETDKKPLHECFVKSELNCAQAYFGEHSSETTTEFAEEVPMFCRVLPGASNEDCNAVEKLPHCIKTENCQTSLPASELNTKSSTTSGMVRSPYCRNEGNVESLSIGGERSGDANISTEMRGKLSQAGLQQCGVAEDEWGDDDCEWPCVVKSEEIDDVTDCLTNFNQITSSDSNAQSG